MPDARCPAGFSVALRPKEPLRLPSPHFPERGWLVASAPWALHRRTYGAPRLRSSTPTMQGFRALRRATAATRSDSTSDIGLQPGCPHIHINPQAVVHIVCRQGPSRHLFRVTSRRIAGSGLRRKPCRAAGVSGLWPLASASVVRHPVPGTRHLVSGAWCLVPSA